MIIDNLIWIITIFYKKLNIEKKYYIFILMIIRKQFYRISGIFLA